MSAEVEDTGRAIEINKGEKRSPERRPTVELILADLDVKATDRFPGKILPAKNRSGDGHDRPYHDRIGCD